MSIERGSSHEKFNWRKTGRNLAVAGALCVPGAVIADAAVDKVSGVEHELLKSAHATADTVALQVPQEHIDAAEETLDKAYESQLGSVGSSPEVQGAINTLNRNQLHLGKFIEAGNTNRLFERQRRNTILLSAGSALLAIESSVLAIGSLRRRPRP